MAFSYNELNKLSKINDWLGTTTIENDIRGRLSKVTDYQDRTVAYEYNSIGEKTKLTYPDGRQALYSYDEEGKLSSITSKGIDTGFDEKTSYAYDEIGRLIEKLLPNGVKQDYSYLPGGNLESMTSTDREGILDKYFYSYNNSGLISGISRERRDLAAVSGQYDYQYDEVGRLTRSSLNGQLRASYEYDAFGNRISLIESNAQTTYRYDALDRLVEAKELNNSQARVRSYNYDKRGNQTNEYVDGLLNKTFTFDATNMLSKVVDSEKGELENQYNGLGFRVASTRPEERIEYLCDLSRDCYNMLERTVNGETESFIYDKNVISMSKAGDNYYYLQDELGSPMYMTGTDGAAVSSYAFDDFGRSIDPFTGKIKEAGNKQHTKHAYTTEGNIIQPFAFTGYQEDDISGLKFAQARFYNAKAGRFQSEDLVKGFTNIPFTLNQYNYCFGCPIGFVDRNGQFLDWVVDKAKQAVDYVKENPKQVAIGAAVAAVGVGIAVAAAPLELSVGAVAAFGAVSSAAIDAGFQEMTSGKIDVSEVVVSGVFGALTAGTLSAGAKNITDKATQWATSKLGQSVAKLGIEGAITGIYGFAQSVTNDVVNLLDNDKENDYDAEEILVRGGVNGLLETGGSFLEGAFKGIAKKIVNRNTTNDVIKNKGELWETWEKWAENGTANQKRQGTKQITKYTRQALKAAEEYVENSWVGKTITGSTILGTNVAEQICTE